MKQKDVERTIDNAAIPDGNYESGYKALKQAVVGQWEGKPANEQNITELRQFGEKIEAYK